jgi:hypothetical protein
MKLVTKLHTDGLGTKIAAAKQEDLAKKFPTTSDTAADTSEQEMWKDASEAGFDARGIVGARWQRALKTDASLKTDYNKCSCLYKLDLSRDPSVRFASRKQQPEIRLFGNCPHFNSRTRNL